MFTDNWISSAENRPHLTWSEQICVAFLSFFLFERKNLFFRWIAHELTGSINSGRLGSGKKPPWNYIGGPIKLESLDMQLSIASADSRVYWLLIYCKAKGWSSNHICLLDVFGVLLLRRGYPKQDKPHTCLTLLSIYDFYLRLPPSQYLLASPPIHPSEISGL